MRIEFEKIDVKISHKEILKSVNLVAEHNKITGIIGPNGSGKSTLIKTLFDIVSKKR